MGMRLMLTVGLVLGIGAAVHAADPPKLPAPFATPSVRNSPRVIPQPAGAKLNLPAGFHMDIWAEGFKTPRIMILGPSREVILADANRAGGVYVLTNDGKDRKPLVENLSRPFGLALNGGFLYVGMPESVMRYKYDPKAMTATEGTEVVSLKGFGTGHWTRSLLFDRAGKKLYVAVGSGSNVSPGEDPKRAAVNVYNPDGSGHEIYASGLRNPTSLHWYPNSDTLWATVQERDELGDDLVPDYFTSVKKGAFYGWPFAYTGPNEDPRNKGQKPDLVAKTIAGDVQLGAHVAVLDFAFYTGNMFPAEYRNGAFLALHGSWNRSKRVGQSIAFVPFKDGKPSGPMKEIITGWMVGPESPEVWGRPVGILQMPDGSLLISEDGNNRIWRLSYKK